MTSKREQDLIHANERGNGPKKRMEGGDETDDITINNPDDPIKQKHEPQQEHSDAANAMKYKKPQQK